MEADSVESLSTALESLMRRTRKLVSNACSTHARTIKVSAALGSALLLFSVSSDAFAPLRQWMINAFEAEYRNPGQARLERVDAPSKTTSQQANDAAIQVALAHMGPIRLASSGESGDIFWTISDSMSTSSEYQAEGARASSDVYRSGFTAAQSRYGAGGHRSRMPLLAFGRPSHLYPSQHLAGIAGPAGMMLSSGSQSQTDSDSQRQDNSRGAEIQPALSEGVDGDKSPPRSDSGADGGPLGAPNEERPTDNAGSPGVPVATDDNPNGNVPTVSVLDDGPIRVLDDGPIRVLDDGPVRVLDGGAVRVLDGGLANKVDEPVLQDLTLPHNGGIANPSTGQEGYLDLGQLRVSDESDAADAAATSVPLPGTLALFVLALPMLVFFHGRVASRRMYSHN